MKTTLVRCMTMVAIAFWVSSAAANSVDVDFEDPSGANLTIYDNDKGGGTPDQVLFSFTNGGGGSIAAIYIDDSDLLASLDSLYESEGVNFTTEGPATLSGGFSADYAARAENNTADGIDESGEFLGIVFNLNPGITLARISEALASGDLKIGLSPTVDGDPTVFNVPPGTNPVPEPTSLVLFGIGTAGLAGLSKKRRKK